MSDPIAAMRFLPLYNLSLHYCGVCRGPMNYASALDADHLDCITKSYKAVADAIGGVAEAFGDVAKSTKALIAGIMAFKRSGNIAFRYRE